MHPLNGIKLNGIKINGITLNEKPYATIHTQQTYWAEKAQLTLDIIHTHKKIMQRRLEFMQTH